MANYIKYESYPTINAENSSKTVDIVYVNIDRKQPSKTRESIESFLRIDPEYGPRKYDTSKKILLPSQSGKIIDENHKKEYGKGNGSKTTDIVEMENQNQNEDKQPGDQHNLFCVVCKRIFESPSGLKSHQRACKPKDLSNNSPLKQDTNLNTKQQLRKNIDLDRENVDDE